MCFLYTRVCVCVCVCVRARAREGGPDKCVNELVRSLTTEKLEIIREWADRALRDAQGAQVLTDEILNCSIRLLHKGGGYE
jgi:hypothetical protein